MHNDEAIKKSIARNSQKKKTESNPPASQSNPGNFKLFVWLMNGEYLAKMALTVSIVLCISVFSTLRQKYEMTAVETLPFLGLPFALIALIYFLYFYVPYIPYQSFLKNKLTALSGWQAFISSRSPEFMKGKRFVRLIVSLQPTTTANTLHHKAISNFLSDWVKRSAHIYAGTKWTKASPDSFKVSGFTVNGHIGVGNGMAFVIRSLSHNLISLIKTLGENNLSFSIKYENELSFEEDTALDSIDAAKDREYERKLRE
jgi:hypothetical protein